MKSDNSVNYILVIFCFVLVAFTVVGSKMADNFLAMQQKAESTSTTLVR
jgi:hypothetical protein